MKTIIKYQKCSDLKRILAFLVDFFFSIISALILLSISLAIFYNLPTYKNSINIQKELENRSGLYIDGEVANSFYSKSDLTIKEQYIKLDKIITDFYSDTFFFENDEKIDEYNNKKLEITYNNLHLFVLENGHIIFTFTNIPDKVYYDFINEELNTNCLYELRNNDAYHKQTVFISITTLTLIVVSLLISFIVFYFIIPLFDKRNRSTLGMKIFKLGLISNSYYSLKLSEFTFRFLFYFIIEFILGFFSFFIIPLISISYMILSKRGEPFHDILINSKMIDISGTKIYKNKFELLNDKEINA